MAETITPEQIAESLRRIRERRANEGARLASEAEQRGKGKAKATLSTDDLIAGLTAGGIIKKDE